MRKKVSLKINLGYHENQYNIFYEAKARFKIIAKGRRFGLTHGMAKYVIHRLIEKKKAILWVDTTYGNIQRYVERYFKPELKKIPKKYWSYHKTHMILTLNEGYCDFRSADKPENIEGFGYDLVILNEAGIILKNRNLWTESIRPMMFDYEAEAIIGGTPKGKKTGNENHLFYELFNYERQGKAGWKSFQFSSFDNPSLSRQELLEYESEVSPLLRDQEIYGKFIDANLGRIFKREWLKFFVAADVYSKKIIKKVQSWDTAYKEKEENDYSVCETWFITNDGYYLIDVWRGRVEFPDLKKKAIAIHEKWKVDEVLIEEKVSGISLIQELRRDTRIPIKPIKPVGDKVSRAHAITPIMEAGKVYLLSEGSQRENTPWLNAWISEHEDFPNGEFKDQVDSTTQFLNYAKDGIKDYDPGSIRTKKVRSTKYKNYRG